MLLIANGLYRFDDFEVQPSRRVLIRKGQKVALAPKTFEVLLCLVQNSGRVVLKDELFKTVWPGAFIEESNLTQHIFWLRKALGDKSGYIVTIPGRGYEFTGRVETVSETESPAGLLPVSKGLAVTIHRAVERTRTVIEEFPAVAAVAPVARTARRGLVVAVAAGVLAVAGLAAWGGWRWTHRVVPGDHHEVVLADFENTTGDAAFDPALKTLLAIDLNQSPYLAVAGDNEIQTALKLMIRNPDERLTPLLAREVCQRLNDQAVLKGLIANFGHKYLVTLSATDCQTGEALAATKATADGREDVLRAVDSVAAEMRRRLGESLQSRPNASLPLLLVHTFSLDALRFYSQAHSLSSAGRSREAIPLYQRAIELDPKFAAAWLDLADSYSKVGARRLSRDAATRAYELGDQGDDYVRLRIVSEYNDFVTHDMRVRLNILTTWTQMYPNQAQPWIELSGIQQALGSAELGIEPGRRAVAVAPNNGFSYSVLCGSLLFAGHLEEAKTTCREAIRRKIDNPDVHANLFMIGFLQHDAAAMEEQEAWAPGTDKEGHFHCSLLFVEGKAHAAVAASLQIIDRYRREGLEERADQWSRILLRREADYNMDEELRKQLPTIDPDGWPLNVTFANAELGRIAEAEAGLKAMAAAGGADTLTREYNYPQAQAAVALARHKPEEAIADLEVARPFDFSSLEGASLRARAYLAAGQARSAELEFRKVIDHDFVSPVTQSVPLAHLGLARALETEGNHAAARREYETLFALWKDADADLRPLLQARAEYAKIH